MVILHLVQNFRAATHKAIPNEEVLENIKDAMRLHIEDRIDSGEEIPQSASVSLTLMEVAV